jgi:fatty acid desaturase
LDKKGMSMKLLGLLQLAVAIYAIVMILQSSAETGAKVLWVLLVLIVPLIGLIIWALMGPGSPLKR